MILIRYDKRSGTGLPVNDIIFASAFGNFSVMQ